MPNPKKKRLWEIDSTLYQTSRGATFLERRVIPALRQVGKLSLITLAVIYPLVLVIVGVVYGGLVFWSFFGISMAIIYFVISSLGFAPRFDNQGQGFKAILGLLGGFVLAAGFYEGLFALKTWFVPTAIGLSALGIVFVLRRMGRSTRRRG